MKIAIVYKSLTGNTKLIAEAIENSLEKEEIVYVGEPAEGIDAELYFIGSWTDKGSCDTAVSEFVNKLEGKQVAYFGTAGFGGSKEYYETLFSHVSTQIPDSNTVLGNFFCQGKMPMSVKSRYEAMLEEKPGDEKLLASIQNFDAALSHPDEADLADAAAWAKAVRSKGMQ